MAAVGSSPPPRGPGELLSFGSLVTPTTVPTIGRCSVNNAPKSTTEIQLKPLPAGRELARPSAVRLARVRGDDDPGQHERLFLPGVVSPAPAAVPGLHLRLQQERPAGGDRA